MYFCPKAAPAFGVSPPPAPAEPRGAAAVSPERGGERSETPLRSCGRAELRPGLPEGTEPGVLLGSGRATSVGAFSFSVCSTERRPEEMIHRRHQPLPVGHGQRLRTAPAPSGVPGSGGRRRYRRDLTRTARAGPGSVSCAGHKGRSANISLWDESFLGPSGVSHSAKDPARIGLGAVGIFPHPCGCGSGGSFQAMGKFDGILPPGTPRALLRSLPHVRGALGACPRLLRAIPRSILLVLKGSG